MMFVWYHVIKKRMAVLLKWKTMVLSNKEIKLQSKRKRRWQIFLKWRTMVSSNQEMEMQSKQTTPCIWRDCFPVLLSCNSNFLFQLNKVCFFFFFHSCSKSIMKQWRPITTLQLIKHGLWPKEEVIVDTIFF